jgi:uncharacterized protein YndB with AHSA1/START domain
MPAISESRVIAAAPEDVWKTLSDLENARRWNRAWTRIEILSPQHHGLGTAFRAHTESGDSFDFEVTEWVPPNTIAFSPIRGDDERYGIVLDSHTFQLTGVGDGDTNVKLTARATAHGFRGHLGARFLWPGYQKHGLRLALDAVQEVFEALEGDEAGEVEEAEADSPASE